MKIYTKMAYVASSCCCLNMWDRLLLFLILPCDFKLQAVLYIPASTTTKKTLKNTNEHMFYKLPEILSSATAHKWNNTPWAVYIQHNFLSVCILSQFTRSKYWGDSKRGRKSRLVEVWRNIISMRSRRGFVLCRLATTPLHLPPFILPWKIVWHWAVNSFTGVSA